MPGLHKHRHSVQSQQLCCRNVIPQAAAFFCSSLRFSLPPVVFPFQHPWRLPSRQLPRSWLTDESALGNFIAEKLEGWYERILGCFDIFFSDACLHEFFAQSVLQTGSFNTINNSCTQAW